MRSTPVSVSLIAVLASACQSHDTKVDLAAAEAAVKEASVNFSAAETSGKPDSALTFIWDDAVLQPPDTAQIEGHDAIRAFYGRAKQCCPVAVGPLSGPLHLRRSKLAIWPTAEQYRPPVHPSTGYPDGPLAHPDAGSPLGRACTTDGRTVGSLRRRA